MRAIAEQGVAAQGRGRQEGRPFELPNPDVTDSICFMPDLFFLCQPISVYMKRGGRDTEALLFEGLIGPFRAVMLTQCQLHPKQ